MMSEKADFEKWLPTVCFQEPTEQARALAWLAWIARKSNYVFTQDALPEKGTPEYESLMSAITKWQRVPVISKVTPAPVCEVCWSSSWQPCEERTQNAVPDKSTGGWMICGFCNEIEHANNLRNEIERMKSVITEFKKVNPIRNDHEEYLYDLASWALSGYWEDGDDVKHTDRPENPLDLN
jgi:hypothetical protein